MSGQEGGSADAGASTRRQVLGLGAAALAAGALAACGSDETTASQPPLPTPPAPLPPRPTASFATTRTILSEPILQNPGPDSVRVVWFSEAGEGAHEVLAGPDLERRFPATTTRMTQMMEDAGSQVFERDTAALLVPELRPVFRHEATITGLPPGRRTPYMAISRFDGQAFRSTGDLSAKPLPRPGEPLTLLLTSDHQNFPNGSAHFQKVEETAGVVDAVLWPGDLVSQPNRASEWFDRSARNNPAFFQSTQGTNQRWVPDARYRGGRIMQFAPTFPCLGNHEYPGRWRMDPRTDNPGNTGARTINAQDNDPQPRWYAEARYEELRATINPSGDPAFRAKWIEDNSYEWTTYRQMWSLPAGPEGTKYYSLRFGDVFLIALDANRFWRVWNANQRGKFTEAFDNALGRINPNSDVWGFGDLEFHPFGRGSRQHQWLQDTLASADARQARYRIVLSHQTMAGLGDNAVPVQAEIVTTIELVDGGLIGPFPAREWPQRWPAVDAARRAGLIRYIRYEYPLAADQWRRDIEPVLLERGVHLVHTGHSHLWNRTRVGTMHYLEASNLGNSFGAMFFAERRPGENPNTGPRPTQPGNAAWATATAGRTSLRWNPADYPAHGEPFGRPMASPTLFNPMVEMEGRPEPGPFVASNALTAFTLFQTATGLVSSYAFDARDPASPTRLFDQFRIGD